jgi:twinkle protein
MRQGEITLFTSGTGSGKSTMIKEIILQLKEETEDNIGMISLEESIGDSAQKFIQMFTPEEPTEEQERKAFDKVFGDNRLILLDHNGAVSDSSLIDQIENLCLLGCKYLVLDHITIAVSEGTDGKTGNEAIDSIMSSLLKIVKKHDVWLGIISHLRKSQGKSFEEGHLASIDDIKGSGSIKQISFDIITFARNLIAQNEEERNTIQLRVLKSRFTGLTGDCGSAFYDQKTKRLKGQVDFLDYNAGA